MENIDMNTRCETSEDYLAAKGQAEEFEPYETHKPSPDTLAANANRWAELMGLERPIDGDALNREAAAELGMTLRSIVAGRAGPKLTTTAWALSSPDLTHWQADVLNAAFGAYPAPIAVTLPPARRHV